MIETTREALLDALATALQAVDRRGMVPILTHVLIEASGHGIRYTASDGEITISGTLKGAVEADMTFTVDAKRLSDIVKALPHGDITMAWDANAGLVTIKGGRSTFKVPTRAGEGFPGIPAFEALTTLHLTAGELASLLNGSAYAVATDESRYGLNGLLLEVRGGRVNAVATDGHRLALTVLKDVAAEGAEKVSALAPRKAVGILSKLAGDVSLGIGRNAVCATVGDVTIYARLLEGEFPDYHQVIPKGGNLVEFDASVLIEALKRVAILSGRTRSIRLDVGAESITVSTYSSDGEASETVPATSEINEAYGVQVDYLIDALKAVGDGGRLYLDTPLRPFRLQGDGEGLHVVMPMRLD